MMRYYDFKLPGGNSVTYRIENDYSVTKCYFKGSKRVQRINTATAAGGFIMKSFEEAMNYILCNMEAVLEVEDSWR